MPKSKARVDRGRKMALDVIDDHARRIRVHSLCTNSGEHILGKFQTPPGDSTPKCPRCKEPMVSGSIVYDTRA